MRLVTVRRKLKNSGFSEASIHSVYEYMLGTPDNTLDKPLTQRRWLIACQRALAMEGAEKKPLSDKQVQIILNQRTSEKWKTNQN